MVDQKFKIRTDLALEAKEDYSKEDTALKGVIVDEKENKELDVHITRLQITNKNGERAIGKPIGTYITFEARKLPQKDEDYHREISVLLADYLKKLIEGLITTNEERQPRILVAGLGNRDVTPDALGPYVVNNMMITRHIVEYMGYDEIEGVYAITSGIIPGVMGQTGIETAEIINGIVKKTKPDLMIAIDALAARSTSRLNTTIQLTDTGIHPGSGVGNHRNAITAKSMGIPVIAIGVPTVVDAATIVNDIIDKCSEDTDPESRARLIQDMIPESMTGMFVTPKDIDETVKKLSFTISEAINICMGNV